MFTVSCLLILRLFVGMNDRGESMKQLSCGQEYAVCEGTCLLAWCNIIFSIGVGLVPWIHLLSAGWIVR